MRSSCGRSFVAVLVLLPLLVLGAVSADAAPVCPKRPATQAEAKRIASQFWQQAVKHHAGGRNVEAIAAWQCAYALAPHPLALYNIGRSAVLSGQVALAVKSYEEYLRLMPKAANRAEVEASLRALRARLPRRVAPRRVAPRRRVAPPTRRRAVAPVVRPRPILPEQPSDPGSEKSGRALRIAGWSVLGVGIGVAVLSGVLGGLAQQAKRNVEDSEPGTLYSDLHSDAQRALRLDTLTWVFAGVGAAVVATGSVLLALGYKARREKRVTVTPTLLRGGAAVSLGGTF